YRTVETDTVEADELTGSGRADDVQHERRNAEREQRPGSCEHSRLDELQSDEVSPARAERVAQRELTLTVCHTGEGRAREIDARDEEQDRGRAEEDDERTSHDTDHIVVQGRDGGVEREVVADVGAGPELLAEGARDRVQLGMRRGCGHAAAKATDHDVVVRG